MRSLHRHSVIRHWLRRNDKIALSLYAGLSAFCLYTCVYAFRKTFSVATFEGIEYLGIDYKVWLVTSQVTGYALSKFVGIKIISELRMSSRRAGILLMVGTAGLSWLLFAIIPRPLNIIFLFTTGFPLGLVWGMVFGYLEGRRDTDALGAGLAVSFIFAAGLCKSVGSFIVHDWFISETWMPFVTSLIFLGPLLLFLWLLDQVPPPDSMDEKLRTKRQPMSLGQRKKFIQRFFGGLVIVIFLYAMLTAFRDFRDNFSAEIWQSLGYGGSPEMFTITEVPISIICLILIGSIVLIRGNKKAFLAIHCLILAGTFMLGAATLAFEQRLLTAPQWMTLVGLGLYLGYIPFNSSFFDRLLAAFNVKGTVGFVMYLADSIGYLGSVSVLFYKQFGQPQLSWLEFFMNGAYILSVIGSLLAIASMIYFQKKKRNLSGRQRIRELMVV